eukprot:TRINITY_DN30301_c0_g1_i1.p1 TRINITY_DN30301_c0_g1~~TRINITY_DN30301_c0_g1_i1.p1  ORF type:complete len:332 (+),score=71.29 TRINITY_DN30301_c0_g1_i1:64-1059(+)
METAQRRHRLERCVLLTAVAVAISSTVMAISPCFSSFRASTLSSKRSRQRIVLRASGKGFDKVDELLGDADDDLMEMAQKMAEAAEKEDEELMVKPKFNLTGPLRAPAAPATYQALTRLRLRKDAGLYSDLVTEFIPEGATFRIIEARPDSESNMIFLRTDRDYGGAWIFDKGVMGTFAGKRVVKRIAGSLVAGKKRKAVFQVDEIDPSEVNDEDFDLSALAPPEMLDAEVEEGRRTPGQDTGPPLGDSPYERKKEILELLEDPDIRGVMEKMGMSTEKLSADPSFIEKVAREMYGEEVVSGPSPSQKRVTEADGGLITEDYLREFFAKKD